MSEVKTTKCNIYKKFFNCLFQTPELIRKEKCWTKRRIKATFDSTEPRAFYLSLKSTRRLDVISYVCSLHLLQLRGKHVSRFLSKRATTREGFSDNLKCDSTDKGALSNWTFYGGSSSHQTPRSRLGVGHKGHSGCLLRHTGIWHLKIRWAKGWWILDFKHRFWPLFS